MNESVAMTERITERKQTWRGVLPLLLLVTRRVPGR